MRTRLPTAQLRPVGLATAVILALASVTACGTDGDAVVSDAGDEPTASAVPTSDSATPTESTSTPDESASATPSEKLKKPQCDSVWVDGAKLPGGYQACFDAEGKRVKADGRYCEFGKPLVTYQSQFWAVPGGPIFEVDGALLDDDHYRDSLKKCSG